MQIATPPVTRLSARRELREKIVASTSPFLVQNGVIGGVLYLRGAEKLFVSSSPLCTIA